MIFRGVGLKVRFVVGYFPAASWDMKSFIEVSVVEPQKYAKVDLLLVNQPPLTY